MDISSYPAPTTFYAKDLQLAEGVELACTPRVVIFNITAKRGAKTEEA